MAMDFPNNPATGATFTGPDGNAYVFDGVKWTAGSGGATGGANLALTGSLTVGGTSTLNGPSTFNQGINVTAATGQPDAIYGAGNFVSTGTVQGNNLISTGPANVTGGLTVQGTGSIFDQGLVVDNATGQADALQVNGGSLSATGNRIIVSGTNSPSFAAFNSTGTGSTFGMWNASGQLRFGICDVSGNPVTTLMHVDASGNVVLLGTLTQSGTP